MRRFAVVVVVWAAMGIVAACSTFTTAADAPDAATDAPGAEAAPPVAPPPPPPTDAADAPYDGTVFYDDFEDNACLALYDSFVATLASTDVAHEGLHGCLLCRIGDAGRPQATRLFVPPPGPGTYEMTYFAKLVGDAAPSIGIASFTLTYPGGSDVEFQGSTVALDAGGWTLVSQGGVAEDGGATTGRAIVLGDTNAPEGTCFAFDDVRLVYKP